MTGGDVDDFLLELACNVWVTSSDDEGLKGVEISAIHSMLASERIFEARMIVLPTSKQLICSFSSLSVHVQLSQFLVCLGLSQCLLRTFDVVDCARLSYKLLDGDKTQRLLRMSHLLKQDGLEQAGRHRLPNTVQMAIDQRKIQGS